jgi:hypothetical protein
MLPFLTTPRPQRTVWPRARPRLLDRTGPNLTESACGRRAGRDDLGQDRDRDLGGRYGADIEADGRMDAGDIGSGEARLHEALDPAAMGFPRAQRADVEAFRAKRRVSAGSSTFGSWVSATRAV